MVEPEHFVSPVGFIPTFADTDGMQEGLGSYRMNMGTFQTSTFLEREGEKESNHVK